MRKKILGSTFVVAMAAIAGYNTYVNQTKVEMSDMALANVEALADYELPEFTITCSSTNYGKCCKLNLISSDFDNTPLYYYCKQSGNPNDECLFIHEFAANYGKDHIMPPFWP